MKGGPGWHPLLPRSFFARTILLVLLVTLFSKMLTMLYLVSNEDLLVDRQYSHGTAMLISSYWAASPETRADIE
ncbi:MAG: hypothetical protein R6V43_12615, partial [Halopseudomonas sp.]